MPGCRLRLLLDEDTQARRLVLLLRAEGHEILTLGETGKAGAPDSEVMRIAAATDRVVLTRNCDDYLALHRGLSDHPGILCVFQDADPVKAMSWHDIAHALKNLESAEVPLQGQFMALNAWLF